MGPLDQEPTDVLALRWSNGEDDAEFALVRRAGMGDKPAQRCLAHGLAIASGRGEQTEAYLAGAEVYARMAAATGAAGDRRALAGVLSMQAAFYRNTARPAPATVLEAECLVLLNGLADEGHDEAAQAMSIFAEEFSVEAVTAAAAKAKEAGSTTPIRLPAQPEQPSPPPVIWKLPAFADLPPPTRWERVKFWFSDRVLDVRLIWWRLCDAVALLRG